MLCYTLIRLLFGPRSDLVRSCFGKHPNKVRTRSERKKTESGRRVEGEWNKTILRKIKMTILKPTEIIIDPVQNQKKWPGINSKPSSNQISTFQVYQYQISNFLSHISYLISHISHLTLYPQLNLEHSAPCTFIIVVVEITVFECITSI